MNKHFIKAMLLITLAFFSTQSWAGNLDDRLAALEAQVTALEQLVQSQASTISSLQNDLTALQTSSVFDLEPYVTVDPNVIEGSTGPHVIFDGVNVHVRSGNGQTFPYGASGPSNGLGNLIIGYNELGYVSNNLGCHDGQNNLIMGSDNCYKANAVGGIISGENNTISNWSSTAISGSMNTTSGDSSVIIGGHQNTVGSVWSVVTGGRSNNVTNMFATVTGGQGNIASGLYSSVSGGQNRESAGDHDWRAGSLSEDF